MCFCAKSHKKFSKLEEIRHPWVQPLILVLKLDCIPFSGATKPLHISDMNIRGLKHTSRGFHSRPKFFLLKYLTILAAVFFIASLLYFFASVTDFPKSFSRARELHFKGNLRDAKFPWNKLCFGPASEKLKLAVFSKTRPIGSAPGGMEHHASTLYNALAARGIEIHVFSAPSDRRPHKDIEVAHLDP